MELLGYTSGLLRSTAEDKSIDGFIIVIPDWCAMAGQGAHLFLNVLRDVYLASDAVGTHVRGVGHDDGATQAARNGGLSSRWHENRCVPRCHSVWLLADDATNKRRDAL